MMITAMNPIVLLVLMNPSNITRHCTEPQLHLQLHAGLQASRTRVRACENYTRKKAM